MFQRYSIAVLIFTFCSIHLQAQSWKTYPHHQAGSVLTFPQDEGYHPGEVVEWWYTNGHVIGDSSGTDYAYMLTYFYYPQLTFDGFRIMELSNENTGDFAQETVPTKYTTLSQTELHIKSNSGFTGSTHEEWQTLKDSANNLIPFEYHINAASAGGALDLTYRTVKRPLMVGGTGFLYEGITGYTYYYSQTMIEASGTFTMNGVSEPVHGFAWIDRQWGQFDPSNGEQYTWMSIQLSNGMDMNLWNIFNTAAQIPDTSTYRFCTIYHNDSTTNTISNFTLERLKYVYSADNQRCYDQKWRLTYGNVDLILTATHSNNEVTLPFRFFEGSMLIEGTVDGYPVTGSGYVELLHSFSKPQIALTNPIGHVNWNGATPITWRLTNPDDGRPVTYDVEISTDNKQNYTAIAQGLTDTFFNWSPNLSPGAQGWFRITARSIDSTLEGTKVADTSFVFGAAGIDNVKNSLSNVEVFPNPFEHNTQISYEIKQAGKLKIDIINLQGQLVRNLFDGFAPTGKGMIEWDGRNDLKADVAAGNYLYRLSLNERAIYGSVMKE